MGISVCAVQKHIFPSNSMKISFGPRISLRLKKEASERALTSCFPVATTRASSQWGPERPFFWAAAGRCQIFRDCGIAATSPLLWSSICPEVQNRVTILSPRLKTFAAIRFKQALPRQERGGLSLSTEFFQLYTLSMRWPLYWNFQHNFRKKKKIHTLYIVLSLWNSYGFWKVE